MFVLHPQLEEDTVALGQLKLCQVLLMNDAQFPWTILVPMRDNITEMYQLDPADQQQLQSESLAISALMMDHFQGDKLNIGALGNIVPQLHLHHIVRFQHDAVWPKPVWGNIDARPYQAAELSGVTQRLIKAINQSLSGFQPC